MTDFQSLQLSNN